MARRNGGRVDRSLTGQRSADASPLIEQVLEQLRRDYPLRGVRYENGRWVADGIDESSFPALRLRLETTRPAADWGP